jgi:Flp pilus assembly protein TadB
VGCVLERQIGIRVLIVSVALFLVSLALCAFTIWSLTESKKEQAEFEATVVTALDKSIHTLEVIENRQTSLEHVVTDSDELRLTINEIKRYNEKQLMTKGWKGRSKRLPIGGGE